MEAHLGGQEKGCCNTLLQDLMREDLRNFFQSPFCFPDPKMATVLFPSLRWWFCRKQLQFLRNHRKKGSLRIKFLTDVKFKSPVIVYNYPKGIKAFYMKVNADNKTAVLWMCVYQRYRLLDISETGLS
ncbi:Asparagine--tRNA ligase, cytoplasmic 1 [Camellia lanceoleosa]|uniref:Asparagine--tRNA ligase, cytoplasmic 1 n=1 Tax=Camellia lanceoleosa TaxID=1840588 RepID=A0ACC0H946_9ERIC|nr:Asparagine--tRNA ligase, cytoplasmic 1 [Camellia lanceoleosa]